MIASAQVAESQNFFSRIYKALLVLLDNKKQSAMALPHALVVSYPTHGHVIPLMELSHRLVDHGFRITFVNTEINHERVAASFATGNTADPGRINFVWVPVDLELGESGTKFEKLTEKMQSVMPRCLQELIRSSQEAGEDITCMIADQGMTWALEVGRRMGLRTAAFWPASAALLVVSLSIPKLIEEGVINANGLPTSGGTFQLGPGMPLMNTDYFAWNYCGDRRAQLAIFNYLADNARSSATAAEFIMCNSFQEIEAPMFTHAPQIVPVGPLRSSERPEKPVKHPWSEDQNCVAWLSSQQASSVVYVAFGSRAILNRRQLHELALGLQLCGRPFLWVVRADQTDGGDVDEACPLEGTGGMGKVVRWSPQHRVLAHPSVGCFVSHCGWNSTVEGISSGVPFLCWPCSTDQFINQGYVCDVWKVGLKMAPDQGGIITREKIISKVDLVLGDLEIKARATALKQAALRTAEQGGSSYQNLCKFAAAMKG